MKHKMKYIKGLVRQFIRLVNDPKQTYFPEAKQKGKVAIWVDNLVWVMRHKEINRFYYAYGLDRKNTDVGREILSYRDFRSIRDKRNLRLKGMNFNYASLMRDKFVFGQLMSSLNFPTPANIALLDNKEFTWLDTMKTVSLDSLVTEKISINGFCKKLTGIKGEGAFPLQIDAGKVFSDGREISLGELRAKMSGIYLLQELVAQHVDLARLHPESVNTLRILTFNNDGNIELFSASLRVGTQHRSVDNWGAGGIAIGIDLDSGTLREYGVYKPGFGGRVKKHPDTGITFLGYPMPYFKECIDLACRLHRYFYGIHSIGWDVAVTPNGPVFIEANEDWDGSFAMSLEDNFKSRFLKMYEKA